MYKVTGKQSKARRGEYTTSHGVIQTPVFMNVATQAAIKGALSSVDLKDVGCQVALANTYHLHVRPGDELIRSLGGLHGFMAWDRPILTDSGGFQIFSLAKLRKITEEGTAFNSHVDGRKIFMSPEDSIRIQANLGSDIVMAFDECIEIPSSREYVSQSCARTFRWLIRCKEEMERQLHTANHNDSSADSLYRNESLITSCRPPNYRQNLFGINQGGNYEDLRVEHMLRIRELDLPGYAIGGLAVGETTEEMYDIVEAVEEHMPEDKPRYLMGVGTPQNIVECVARGVDFFDCVMPARNGRHGHFYTWGDDETGGIPGRININNEKFKDDDRPIDKSCGCSVCKQYTRAYIRHLFKSGEMLGLRFGVLHNLFYYNELLRRIRSALDNGTFDEFARPFK